ncbi:hypothetical protein ERX35_000160 [Macrococcus equipercicus]|uniref:Holin n=1 Tax=Macrococcus equipercicus TaxID=69967 RepID=A0ABQ6RAU3_9STAP|nr:hypothetical protein [Macrococcus equipercicus]KAA1042331.1 hypothetical protein ERX35_000160 [Macrococcus equipercicus]
MGYFYVSLFSNMLLLMLVPYMPFDLNNAESPVSLLVVLNLMTLTLFRNEYDRWQHGKKCFLYLPVHLLLSLLVIVLIPEADESFTERLLFTVIVFLTFSYAADSFIRLLDRKVNEKGR